MNPLVIVGTGLAGYTLAREWRKIEKDQPLLLLTQDGGESYSKPMLSAACSKQKKPDDLVISNAENMASALGAEIRTHVTVHKIDPLEKSLVLHSTEKIYWSKLVLACGADPIRLPLKGNAAHLVHSVNNLDDYRKFREKLFAGARIGILGGGLIGCEFAHDLADGGFDVGLHEAAPTLLSALIPSEVSHYLLSALQNKNIRVYCGTSVVAIEREEDQASIRLISSNHVYHYDIVLSAVGLRPRLEPARSCGIETDRGILIDSWLRTSMPDIFALGDCAQSRGAMVLPYVLPLMNQARTLAKNLQQAETELQYPVMPIVVKTPDFPWVIVPPPANRQGIWHWIKDEDGVEGTYLDQNNKVCAYILGGKSASDNLIKARYMKMIQS